MISSVMGRAVVAIVLGSLTALSAVSAQADDDDDAPSPFHLELDIGYVKVGVGWISSTTIIPLCPDGGAIETCTPRNLSVGMARASASLGYGVLNLEGTFARSLDSSLEFTTWSAGLRVETSYTALFSLYFRGHYQRRFGDLEGNGGRLGIGLLIRPHHLVGVYGEAAIDVSTVPRSMQEAGTILSWAKVFGFGVRFVFSP